MNPKLKANELFEKYYQIGKNHDFDFAKDCTLIAVDLHLEELSKMKLIFSDRELHYNYWQEVKQEIQKL
jgi:hypothetical protein